MPEVKGEEGESGVKKIEIEENVVKAENCLGIIFKNKDLLAQALIHRSFSFEAGVQETNERLEFLGDSVLNLVVTDIIFKRFPNLAEGNLAKLRANLVNANTLANVAQNLGLGECILMGRGAELTGGRQRTSILSGTFEAVIGAIYLDKGIKIVKDFVIKMFSQAIEEQASKEEYGDPKTRLQEYVMAEFGDIPRYRIVKEYGPVHDRTFEAAVWIEGEIWGRGAGKSKKKAEQMAAEEAIKRFEEREEAREDLP
jgi:ribonuclease-3